MRGTRGTHRLCFAGGAVSALVFGLNGQNLVIAAGEALFVGDEFGGEEAVGQFVCEGGADDARAEDNYVHIVVFHALMRGVSVMAHAGADAGNFVGGNADAYAGAADEDAFLADTGENGLAYFF